MPAGNGQLPPIAKRDRTAARTVEHHVTGNFGQRSPPWAVEATATAPIYFHASPPLPKKSPVPSPIEHSYCTQRVYSPRKGGWTIVRHAHQKDMLISLDGGCEKTVRGVKIFNSSNSRWPRLRPTARDWSPL
jgi:hypothetical protein